MKYLKIILLIVLFHTVLISQELKIEFEEIFTIGNDEDAEDEYIFSYQLNIVTDSEGNFYVLDQKNPPIKKYSQEGKFLYNVGRRGKGPGEYGLVYEIIVNHKDELLVFVMGERKIVFFDKQGNFKRNVIVKKGWSSNFFEFADGQYLLYNENIVRNGKCFIEYDDDFDEIKGCFGEIKNLLDMNSEMIQDMISHTGFFKIKKLDKNRLLILSMLEPDQIKIMEKKKDNWEVINFKGPKYNRAPFIEISLDDILNRKYRSSMSIGSKKRYRLAKNYIPQGIVTYHNKYFLSVYENAINSERFNFCVDFYDYNGKFINTQILKEINKREITFEVLAQYDDFLYILTTEKELPVIKKLKIKVIEN